MLTSRRRFLYSAAVAAASHPLQAVSGQLNPTTTLDFTSLANSFATRSLTVLGFRATASLRDLWISGTPNGFGSRIARIDSAGKLQQTIEFPPQAEVNDFDNDATTNQLCVLLTPRGQLPSLNLYDTKGTLIRTLPAPSNWAACCIHNNAPLVLSISGQRSLIHQFDQPDAAPIAVALEKGSNDPLFRSLPGDTRVVVVDKMLANITFVDLATGSLVPFAPRNSDIAVPSATGNIMRRVLFYSMTADSNGRLFFGLGPYRLAAGAPIINFSANGNLVSTVRCTVPTFDIYKDRNNPSGFMPVWKIGAANSTLFLVSPRGHVAIYQV